MRCKILYPPSQNFGGEPSPLSPVVYAFRYHCPPLEGPQSADDSRRTRGYGGEHSRTVYLSTPFLFPTFPFFYFSLSRRGGGTHRTINLFTPFLPLPSFSFLPFTNFGGGGGCPPRTVHLFTLFLTPFPFLLSGLSGVGCPTDDDGGEAAAPPPPLNLPLLITSIIWRLLQQHHVQNDFCSFLSVIMLSLPLI